MKNLALPLIAIFTSIQVMATAQLIAGLNPVPSEPVTKKTLAATKTKTLDFTFDGVGINFGTDEAFFVAEAAKFTTDRNGIKNAAYKLDGQALELHTDKDIDFTAGIEISLWVKADPNKGTQTILARGKEKFDANQFSFALQHDNGVMVFKTVLNRNMVVVKSEKLIAGSWNKVTLRWKADGTQSLAVNGAIDIKTAQHSNYRITNNKGQKITLGGSPWSTSEAFSGSVDELTFASY